MSRAFAIVCFLAVGQMATAHPDEWAVFECSQFGLKFRYPSSLVTVSEEMGRVTLVHRVPYRHEDPCDFSGEGAQVDDVVDFEVRLTVVETRLIEAFRSFEPGFATSRFLSGDRIKTSPGYIDTTQIGSFQGYRLTIGAEGCGLQRYYLRIEDQRTMVVTWTKVSELSGSYRGRDAVRALPDLIHEDEATKLLEGIISSCNPID